MAKHDETPTPRDVDAADAVDEEMDAFRAVWQTDSGGEQAGSFWVEAPNFPVVRRAYRRDLAATREQLTQATTRPDGGQQRVGADAYEAIAAQIADLIRSAGLQADQIRREATEEADRVLSQARMEAGDMVREAQIEADAFRVKSKAEADRVGAEREEILRLAREEGEALKREALEEGEALKREAQVQADRVGAEREEILRQARDESSQVLSNAETDAKRHLEEAERELARARAESDRMLNAGISRRDLVRAEMLALRERLVGAMALLDLGAETESGPTQATLALEQDVVEMPGADQADDQSVA